MAAADHETLAYRLSTILTKLNLGESVDPHDLAQEFGVNVRTIQRDLNQRFAYLPLERSNGGYRLDGAFLGRITAKDIERFAALAGVRGLFPALTDAFLRDILDTRLGPSISVRGHHYESLSGKEQAFRALEQAIIDRRKVSFRYSGKAPRQGYSEVDPYKLINHKGIWYLAAKHKSKIKSFSFTLMESVFVDDTQFCPDPAVERQVDGESLWLGAEPMEVLLEVSPDVASYFKRRPLLVNQSIESELGDGRLLVSARVGHVNEILPQVRYWLPHVKIIRPRFLQDQLAAELAAYLDQLIQPSGGDEP